MPEKSVVYYHGQHFVFVDRGEKNGNHIFEKKKVEIGSTAAGKTEIRFEENYNWSNELFVTVGAHDLLSKMVNTGEEE